MLFDINNYNQNILFFSFIFYTGGIFFILKKKLSNILDPLALHIFWITGNLAFLTSFIYKYNFTILSSLFFLFFCLYTFFLSVLLPNFNNNNISNNIYKLIELKEKKIKIIYNIITILYFISKKPFFIYALANPSITSWFLFRFVDLQGRDALLRILETGSTIYFFLFSFILIFILKTWKKLTIFFMVIAVLIGIFSGGRSALLIVLLFLGAFIFYFNVRFSKSFLKKLNLIGLFAVISSLVIAIVVTSYYSEGDTISNGFYLIINRFIAVGDGLEYYMLYDGPHQIHSGINNYFMAVFGVYVKQFTGSDYKNVGTQLTELVIGNVSFAQGANFAFPLQAMVLGFYSWILYIPVIGFLVAKLRANRSKTLVFLPLSFFLTYHCFTIAEDMEYGVLCLISGTLIYVLFIFPILKINFKIKN